MPPKKLHFKLSGELEPENEPLYKPKVKIWDDTATREYWLKRDRIIFKMPDTDEQTKQDILKRYGK